MESTKNYQLSRVRLTSDENYIPRKCGTIPQERLDYLWRKVRQFAFPVGKFSTVSKNIKLYGARKHIYLKSVAKQRISLRVAVAFPCGVISPKSSFKKIWSATIAILLIYTATITPYRIAFADSEWVYIDPPIDILFFLDIIMSCMTPYYDEELVLVISRGKILVNYLTGWFLLDLLGCLPLYWFFTDTELGSNNYSILTRLLRLPRFYRLFRILKIFRYMSTVRINYLVKLQQRLRIHTGVYNLIKFTSSVFMIVHIVGCLWYLTAQLCAFSEDTWVFRYNYQDSDSATKYIASIYWVFTTMTTVGYGDISPYTGIERSFTLLVMIFGV